MAKKMAKAYYDRIAPIYQNRRGLLGPWDTGRRESILQALDVKHGELVLDTGCGSGFNSFEIGKLGGKPFAVDASERMVREARKLGVPAMLGDIEELEYKEKFDKALFAGSLECCENPGRALEKGAGALKKGGKLVVSTPVASLFGMLFFMFHLGHGWKANIFKKDELRQLVESMGLDVKSMEMANPLDCTLEAVKK